MLRQGACEVHDKINRIANHVISGTYVITTAPRDTCVHLS